jgi:superfamily II DNA or RNA helicase
VVRVVISEPLNLYFSINSYFLWRGYESEWRAHLRIIELYPTDISAVAPTMCVRLRTLASAACKVRIHSKVVLVSPGRRFCSSYTLRPYQQECVDKIVKAFNSGYHRVAASLPTGSGKTVSYRQLHATL